MEFVCESCGGDISETEAGECETCGRGCCTFCSAESVCPDCEEEEMFASRLSNS